MKCSERFKVCTRVELDSGNWFLRTTLNKEHLEIVISCQQYRVSRRNHSESWIYSWLESWIHTGSTAWKSATTASGKLSTWTTGFHVRIKSQHLLGRQRKKSGWVSSRKHGRNSSMDTRISKVDTAEKHLEISPAHQRKRFITAKKSTKKMRLIMVDRSWKKKSSTIRFQLFSKTRFQSKISSLLPQAQMTKL